MANNLSIKDGFSIFLVVKLGDNNPEGRRKGIFYAGALDTIHTAIYLDKENSLVFEVFVLGESHSVKIDKSKVIGEWLIVSAMLQNEGAESTLKLQVNNEEKVEKVTINPMPIPEGGAIGAFKDGEITAGMSLAQLAIYSRYLKNEEVLQLYQYFSKEFALEVPNV